MAISSRLNKRLRASRDDDEEDDFEEEISSSADEQEDASDNSDQDEDDGEESVVSEEEDSENASAGSDGDEDEDEDDDKTDEDEDDQSTGSANDREAIQSEFRKISFGALAKAQNSLGRKRKRGADPIAEDKAPSSSSSSTLEDVREKLRRARERKLGLNRNGSSNSIGRNDTGTNTETENRFSKPNPPPSRSSKHAPTVLSSKMAVSRKRIVIEPPASATKSRDPRFDPTVLASSSSSSSSAAAAAAGRHKDASEKAYAFLDEYRAAELKQLKDQLARTKDVATGEELKRAITSATDRQRALDNKKREREVLSEHKRREKQLIKEGKKSQPYYLKKSELKKEVLKKKYESMGSRERVKALERKRKRVASKEKKDLPWSRRGME